MHRLLPRRVLSPIVGVHDWLSSSEGQRQPAHEGTKYPRSDWDLRTVIALLPPDAPFRFLNLNTVMGFTGTPFDQVDQWTGDPSDAFDLQFCLQGDDVNLSCKSVHSIDREVQYRPGEAALRLGDRVELSERGPKLCIEYRQPVDDLSLSLVLEPQPSLHWWARLGGFYSHYTTPAQCTISWRLGTTEGTCPAMALYEHGWGRRLATGALLALFRYEVLRLPDDGLLIALWTEGPGGLLLKCAGLLCMPDGSRHRFGNYECEILEHDLCENRAGRLCRSPRRWLGRLTGRRGTIRWEAERRGQVCPVIGDGFMAGLDYVIERGDVLCESAEGAGYAEQFGVAWGDQE